MRRLRVLKLGDELYSESLQHVVPEYRRAFPQREEQLYGLLQDVEIVRLSHQRLLAAESRQSVRDLVGAHLRDGRFDFVLVDNPLSMLILGDHVDLPIVFDCIDWYEEMYAAEFDDPAGAAVLRSCFEECVRRATAVVAQSPVMLRAVRLLAEPRFAAVVPNGYNEALFHPLDEASVEAARRQIDARHGVSLSGRRVIAYTGKIGYWYAGLRQLIEALDAERDLLLLVGDGPLLPELPRRDNVVVCGVAPLADVPSYTGAADLLAFPLGADCSPIVISEYLAAGRPIVAPRGRLEWLLRDGVTGALVDGSVAGWRAGIERAYAARDDASAYNQRLARKLSWRTQAARLEAFLRRVATGREEER